MAGTWNNPRTLQATIHIPLSIAGVTDDWITQLMGKVSTDSSVRLTRASSDTGLGAREWKPLYAADGSWMEKILIQLSNETDLRQVHSTIQGKQINISGSRAAIAMRSDYIDLES